jgi:hypothetical protein
VAVSSRRASHRRRNAHVIVAVDSDAHSQTLGSSGAEDFAMNAWARCISRWCCGSTSCFSGIPAFKSVNLASEQAEKRLRQ